MTPLRWRIALWTVTALITGVALWHARGALLPFAFGAVAAYAISPLVDHLAGVVPAYTRTQDVLRRGVAALAIYLLFFGSITLSFLFVVPVALEQINNFAQELPAIIENVQERGSGWLAEYERVTPIEIRGHIERFLEGTAETLLDGAGMALQRSFVALTQTIGVMFGFAIVPFWMFYVIRDRHFINANIMRGFPSQAQEDLRRVARMVDVMLGRYIRGQLFLGLVVGSAVGISMTLLGVQMSLALGVWAGITELIPIIGPWLGAIPALLIVAVTEPQLLPWVALAFLLIQQLENNLLVPRVQGQALDLHPAVVITLVILGGALWGFIGVLVIVPVAGILRELFWYADRRLRGDTPDEAFAASVAGGRRQDRPLDRKLDEPEHIEELEEALATSEQPGS